MARWRRCGGPSPADSQPTPLPPREGQCPSGRPAPLLPPSRPTVRAGPTQGRAGVRLGEGSRSRSAAATVQGVAAAGPRPGGRPLPRAVCRGAGRRGWDRAAAEPRPRGAAAWQFGVPIGFPPPRAHRHALTRARRRSRNRKSSRRRNLGVSVPGWGRPSVCGTPPLPSEISTRSWHSGGATDSPYCRPLETKAPPRAVCCNSAEPGSVAALLAALLAGRLAQGRDVTVVAFRSYQHSLSLSPAGHTQKARSHDARAAWPGLSLCAGLGCARLRCRGRGVEAGRLARPRHPAHDGTARRLAQQGCCLLVPSRL